MKQQIITYKDHKITCSYDFVGEAGYYWRTTSEIPNYPGCLAKRTFEKLEATVKSAIDRWSDDENMTTKLTLEDFNQLTQHLIGQPLSQVSTSYGDVTTFHFGKLTNYTYPKLRDLKKGEWQLEIKMSEWTGNTNSLFKSQTLVNLNIKDNLQLTFTLAYENGLTTHYKVMPDLTEAELPYWELWLHVDSYITASSKGLELKLKDEVIK